MRQPPAQRHHDRGIADEMHDGGPPDVARRAVGRGGDHLDGVGHKEQGGQSQGRGRHRQQHRIAVVGRGQDVRRRPDDQGDDQAEGRHHADADQTRAHHAVAVLGAIGPADQHGRRRRQPHGHHEDDGRNVQGDGPGRGLHRAQLTGDEGHGREGPDLDEIAGPGAIADLALLALGRQVALRLGEDAQRPRLGQAQDVDDQKHRQRRPRAERRPGRGRGARLADAQQVRHQHQIQQQIDAVGDPHGPHAGLGPAQGLQEELSRHADQIGGHRQGEDDQGGRRPLAQAVGQARVAHQPGTQRDQGDHGNDADLQRIGRAPAQHGADLMAPSLAQHPGGHHLHPHHQADSRGQDDGGRRPGQGVEGQLFAGMVAHDNGVGQPHGHDAQTRQHHRPGQGQKVFQGGAGRRAEGKHGRRQRPCRETPVNSQSDWGLSPTRRPVRATAPPIPAARPRRRRRSGRRARPWLPDSASPGTGAEPSARCG